MTINSIPKGYHSATPYLCVKGAANAIAFYKRAFNAKELFRIVTPKGTIGHSGIKIGDSIIMVSEAREAGDDLNPFAIGGESTSIYLYVHDVDTQFIQAVDAGAKVIRPVQDQFYGDRNGVLEDPFGQLWNIATNQKELTPDEVIKRAKAFFTQINAKDSVHEPYLGTP